jgi:hypothetical protein
MASRPNFDPVLKLPDRKKYPDRGPDAGGPVGDGERLRSVYVWILQNGETRNTTWAAAAEGKGPSYGADVEAWGDATKAKHKWTVETKMLKGSGRFRTNRAALATALALVDRKDGTLEAYWWTEAVLLQ